jgi:hypothetical protein
MAGRQRVEELHWVCFEQRGRGATGLEKLADIGAVEERDWKGADDIGSEGSGNRFRERMKAESEEANAVSAASARERAESLRQLR